MKNLLLIAFCSFGLTSTFAQTSIALPGEDNKTLTINGEMLGEMIRSTGGVDKKSEMYYYSFSDESLTIWKHIRLLEDDKTEGLYVTKLVYTDIDWTYLASSFPEGPTAKKVAGRDYYILSLNAQRGKRFAQDFYQLKSTPVAVTVGNLDINITDEAALKAFYDKLMEVKK